MTTIPDSVPKKGKAAARGRTIAILIQIERMQRKHAARRQARVEPGARAQRSQSKAADVGNVSPPAAPSFVSPDQIRMDCVGVRSGARAGRHGNRFRQAAQGDRTPGSPVTHAAAPKSIRSVITSKTRQAGPTRASCGVGRSLHRAACARGETQGHVGLRRHPLAPRSFQNCKLQALRCRRSAPGIERGAAGAQEQGPAFKPGFSVMAQISKPRDACYSTRVRPHNVNLTRAGRAG